MSRPFWNDPSPFWQRVIVFGLMLGACTLAAFVNASNFDQTEVVLLTMLAGILGVREVIGGLIQRSKES